LAGADLREADLTGANLREADLTRADLTEAEVRPGAWRVVGSGSADADIDAPLIPADDLLGRCPVFPATCLARFSGLPRSAAAPPSGRRLCRSGLRPRAGQFGADGIEVTLGALGPGAQFPARLLEHLALAGGIGPHPLEFGVVRPGHLGEAAGGVAEPSEDLVPFPLRVGAQLAGLAGGVFPGPGGFRACVLGACLGGGGALVRLRGLREGLVASVPGRADPRVRVGLRALDRVATKYV